MKAEAPQPETGQPQPARVVDYDNYGRDHPAAHYRQGSALSAIEPNTGLSTTAAPSYKAAACRDVAKTAQIPEAAEPKVDGDRVRTERGGEARRMLGHIRGQVGDVPRA